MSARRNTPFPDISNILVLPFPLRQNYMAQVVVPKDLTPQEADRLSAFVMTLCMPIRDSADEEKT